MDFDLVLVCEDGQQEAAGKAKDESDFKEEGGLGQKDGHQRPKTKGPYITTGVTEALFSATKEYGVFVVRRTSTGDAAMRLQNHVYLCMYGAVKRVSRQDLFASRVVSSVAYRERDVRGH